MARKNALESSYLRNSVPREGERMRMLAPLDREQDLLSTIVSEFQSSNAAFRLKPDRLLSIISDADAGDPREQAALFSTVQEKEPLFAAHLQTRRLAVLSCPWHVQGERHQKEAEAIEGILRRAGLRSAMSHLLDAIGTGYAGVAVDWLPGAAGIRRFTPIQADAWTFDEGGFPALQTVTGGEIPLAQYHPAQVIYVQTDGKAGLPSRKGVMRTLLWLYLFKNTAFRNWGGFLERFGIPFILGKIPSSDFSDARKRETLLSSILAVRSGGAGVGTTETDMQLLNGVTSGNQEAFERYQRYCDEIATLVILGQLASSAKASGLSGGDAQSQVRQDILAADCLMLTEKLNVTVAWLCKALYGMDDPDGIELVIDCEPAEDMNQRAERDAKLAQATGCRLSREYAMKKYGVELEEYQEPAEPPASPVPGGFSDTRPRPKADPAARIVRSALSRMVDADAFEAWRAPIDGAVRRAFGDIDPDADDILEQFRERAPVFLRELPGLMDAFTADELVSQMQQAMLAAFLNGSLPPDFWRRRGTAK